jgi:peroxiredoxin
MQNQSDEALPILVTISVDESAEAVRKFAKTLNRPLPFLVLHDPDGAFSRQLGVTKFPETFLIDSKGKILQKWIGPQDWLSLEVLQFLKKSCT